MTMQKVLAIAGVTGQMILRPVYAQPTGPLWAGRGDHLAGPYTGKGLPYFEFHFMQMGSHLPFYESREFILLAILVFLLGLYFVIRQREKNIRSIEATKIELEKLRSENYRSKLEMEKINNFFSSSLLLKNNIDDVIWDVTKNLIAKLDFEDCLIYMWNEDKTMMVQRAGFGVKDTKELLAEFPCNLARGQGIVGTVAQEGKAIIVYDTATDPRYLQEGYSGQSEIAVPIKYEEELIGVIDSEHSQKGFFTEKHLQMMNTIATLMANKIKAIESERQLRKQKAEIDNISRQLTEVQLAALRGQMNPHFIFNALNSIKKFVLTNDAANADKYLGKFSKLIRSILDNSRSGIITVAKEIDMLTLYLELEKLRFGEKLSYHLHVDLSLAEGSLCIPTMIVQPFVENAILHGIMHKETGGKIRVSFTDHEKFIEISIGDNGVGRKEAARVRPHRKGEHTSLGIDVTTQRLLALKTDPDVPAGIEIADLSHPDGSSAGTRVTIFVPVKFQAFTNERKLNLES
jgi:putative methionine-R-sulfoxide reductase with GAF domain